MSWLNAALVASVLAVGCAGGGGGGSDSGGDGSLDSATGDGSPGDAAGDSSTSGCTTAADCDDGDACTTDLCEAGACTYDAVECDDGLFCNGAEVCDPTSGCGAGTPPIVDDSVGCTLDACDEEMGAVTHTPEDSACDDGLACNGFETCDLTLDCQDGPPRPSEPEICDGQDNDCNGLDDFGNPDVDDQEQDLDGDGIFTCAGDCDDTDPLIGPGAVELCDGIDNDCNLVVDDGLSIDSDGDGHYAPGGCEMPDDDCDDTDPTIFGGAPDVLCDGVDQSCSGSDALPVADDDLASAMGVAVASGTTCGAGDDFNAAVSPASCVDLDGPDVAFLWTAPAADIYGFGTGGSTFDTVLNVRRVGCPSDELACDDNSNIAPPAAFVRLTLAAGDQVLIIIDGAAAACGDYSLDIGPGCVDRDGDGFTDCMDCDDTDPAIFPGAVELCDGIDNDCDGSANVAGAGSETDGDGDGQWACQGDCDDTDPTRFTGNTEVCDGVDNDCNGLDDVLGYSGSETDGDGDGLSDCGGDCNDAAPTVYPGATEICDGIDQDCTGTPDDASILSMCGATSNVGVTTCGGSSGCEISMCLGGFYNTDGLYSTGCNCADDSNFGVCGAANDLGSVSTGGSALSPTGTVPVAGLADWFVVDFPTAGRPGGGNPAIDFARNDGSIYHFDLFYSCSGSAICGDVRSWDFRDGADGTSGGYRTNSTAWPSTVFIRVSRRFAGTGCESYQLSVTR